MNTSSFLLARIARIVLEQKSIEKEKELMNKLRFADLPKVGNLEPQGGTIMGSLTKFVEQAELEKTAAPKEEEGFTLCDKVKLAAAHTFNYVEAVRANGGTIKTASMEGEFDSGLIEKTAQIIVLDDAGMLKEAINMDWLKNIVAKARGGVESGAKSVKDFVLTAPQTQAGRAAIGGVGGAGLGAGVGALTGDDLGDVLGGAAAGGALGTGAGLGVGTGVGQKIMHPLAHQTNVMKGLSSGGQYAGAGYLRQLLEKLKLMK